MGILTAILGFLSNYILPLGFLFIVVIFFYSILIVGRKGTSTLWGKTPRRRRG